MFSTKKRRHVPLLGERRRKIVEKIPSLKGVKKWKQPFPVIFLLITLFPFTRNPFTLS